MIEYLILGAMCVSGVYVCDRLIKAEKVIDDIWARIYGNMSHTKTIEQMKKEIIDEITDLENETKKLKRKL